MSRSAKTLILMTVALVLVLALMWTGDGSSHRRVSGGTVEARLVAAQLFQTSTIDTVSSRSSRPSRSFARPRTWHYRLKSVLQSKDGISFQPVELGPADFVVHAVALTHSTQHPILSLPLISLRC